MLALKLFFLTTILNAATKVEMVTLTKDQWDGLNNKLEYWFYGFLAFIAKEVWEMVKGKGKKLGDIETKVNQILGKLENVATKEYVQEKTKEAIEHYHEISG